MDSDLKEKWETHFSMLEIKTFDKNALKSMLDQVMVILNKRGIVPNEMKGGMWASFMEGEERYFGMMILFKSNLEFIGGSPNSGELKTFSWDFNQIISIEKVEDQKLGIVRAMELKSNQKTIQWVGLKGFVPSLFISILEEFWYS
ncbi:hypothetical protein [Flammeovirga kamogawensis]|uniref:Uncharacterized protein n=1 Tax=Flammeovirga kamogawensis TaxID=373891 RepID=A0ABX8GUE9_9BACT|nr:hypothetical protein [Flammeovirga kamogawensis]MBB6459924.1 hypothetical protein [Flammeovirga kamogawensis]QWG07023.1 hypothetical protein KM029_17235 [Flammeovirga kamogawensis]TRX68844.1 hypothetical protein EO216_12220 [Flammeovirga kamogawensis]